MLRSLLTLLACAGLSTAYYDPHYSENHSTMVHLFEWKWNDIADECENFLGPKGFGGVQISPPNENLILADYNRPWWERYQPISYSLVTRSGNEEQFADMVKRCNTAGVRIYADAVINQMAATVWNVSVGTGGSVADFSTTSYPAVPYDINDFHQPFCGVADSDYVYNATKVRNCDLSGLKDLNQTAEHVRSAIVDYMNKLIDHGVAGFRIDAAKHMSPSDLEVIYGKLNNLNTDHGFPSGARPYIYQEVIDYGNEAISRDEYSPLAVVTEFKVGKELSNFFSGGNTLSLLVNWGPESEYDLLSSDVSLVFIENHDNQRNHGGGGDILTYKNSSLYTAAIAFMLAHPYGQPQILSGFNFTNSEAGPPMDTNGDTLSPSINTDGTCGNGWVCEHRWRQIFGMVGFRNAVLGTDINGWWDNGNNQIAFSRGTNGFIAINGESSDLDQDFQTYLPAGTYCDVISGSNSDGACSGKSVTVAEDGTARIVLGANEEDMVLAIHVGSESLLSSTSYYWEVVVDDLVDL